MWNIYWKQIKKDKWFIALWFLALIVILLGLNFNAHSKEVLSGRYEATVVSVYDGDTFRAKVAIWPGLVQTILIRVRGVNTPEIRGKCAEEKVMAKEARDFLATLLGDVAYLENVFLGKYAGRVIATVYTVEGMEVSFIIIENGHGEYYDGKSTRRNWCAKNPKEDQENGTVQSPTGG